MKQFMKRIFLFGLALCLSMVAFLFWQSRHTEQQRYAEEVFYAMDVAEQANAYTVVLLGDSVCRQLFAPEYQNENDTVCYLPTNQAVTVAGNYILLQNYLEHNPQTKKVIYLAGPQSFANNMWMDYSYHYFVLPFCTDENMQYLDADTKKMIEDRFGKMYVENTKVKEFLTSHEVVFNLYINRLQQNAEMMVRNRISRLAVNYLCKMRDLCKEKGIELTVICTPLDTNNLTGDLTLFKQDIIDYGLDDIMEGYVDNIKYYEDAYFMDQSHFTAEGEFPSWRSG